MKNTWIIAFLILFAGCSVQQQALIPQDKNLITQSQGEEEEDQYEVVIMDPGFDSWYAMNWSPANDRSYNYYNQWNDRYVIAWNEKATRPTYSNFFSTTIQYDPTTDYGMDVARTMYYYFRWVETELKIPILNSVRPVGI